MELQRITKHTNPSARREKWHVVDAEGERLGRLATKIAGLLQGKHRPDYSRHQLSEDFVIVVNAAKIGVSGAKMTQKVYYRHSGYLGGMRTRTLEEMLARFPARVIELAVKGMLPRNRLGRRMLRRLKVYADASHPHEAQVRIGMGKPKQAPAEPPPPPPRRRRRAAPAQTAAPPSDAPETEPETAEDQAPVAEEPQPAVEQAPDQSEPEEAAEEQAAVAEQSAADAEQADAVAEDAADADADAEQADAAAEDAADADAEAEQADAIAEDTADADAEAEQADAIAEDAADADAEAEQEQSEEQAPDPESADADAEAQKAEGERK